MARELGPLRLTPVPDPTCGLASGVTCGGKLPTAEIASFGTVRYLRRLGSKSEICGT